MSDLSWNPLTWTPSNLAEGLSDAIGLPEVVGDLVGGGVSLLTGDFAGAIDQGIDFAENVFAAVSWDNDKFLHGPGGIPSPDCKCCPPNTYPPGEPSGPTDMGPFQRLGKEIDEAFGLSPTKKPGTTSQTGQAGGVGELEITGKESVEELILKILLHLKKSAKARMQETALELKALSDQQNQIGQQMKGSLIRPAIPPPPDRLEGPPATAAGCSPGRTPRPAAGHGPTRPRQGRPELQAPAGNQRLQRPQQAAHQHRGPLPPSERRRD